MVLKEGEEEEADKDLKKSAVIYELSLLARVYDQLTLVSASGLRASCAEALRFREFLCLSNDSSLGFCGMVSQTKLMFEG